MTLPNRYHVLIHGSDDISCVEILATHVATGPHTALFLRGDEVVGEVNLDNIILWQLIDPEETNH